MAKRVRVKLDEAGMGRFLAGSAVAGMVRSSGERVAAAAGEGFEADTWISPTRGTSRRGHSNPPRVVSGVLLLCRGQGVYVSTLVPVTRGTGMARVFRVGGEAENMYKVRRGVLVEVCADDQPASFTLCRSLWGMVVAFDSQDSLPGL